MRKLVVSEFVTLDGVIEDPAWTFPFRSEEQEAFKFAEPKAADALLLGRVTYDHAPPPRRDGAQAAPWREYIAAAASSCAHTSAATPSRP